MFPRYSLKSKPVEGPVVLEPDSKRNEAAEASRSLWRTLAHRDIKAGS